MVLVVKNPPPNAGDIRDAGLIPGLGRSLEGGHGNPFQYSCLENPMDRGAWWATVHGVTESCPSTDGHDWTNLAHVGCFIVLFLLYQHSESAVCIQISPPSEASLPCPPYHHWLINSKFTLLEPFQLFLPHLHPNLGSLRFHIWDGLIFVFSLTYLT